MLSPNDPGTLHRRRRTRCSSRTIAAIRGRRSAPISRRNANRDTIVTMGLKGSDIRISRDDGMSQWPAIVVARRVAEAAGRVLRGHRRRLRAACRATAARRGTNITKNLPGFPAGGVGQRSRAVAYDAGTVYVTVDNHRLNDYEPYIWVSNDFGATFRSLVGNLAGENVQTLTEDQRNRDVLYIGTETGIFLSLDRGKSWQRLKANFPNVRVDEITLHPRDNAMLVATHGRALWILDHLEPIQEYAAAQAAAATRSSSRVPTALEWKTKDDRNDEFWGHQYFIGENPPNEAVDSVFPQAAGDRSQAARHRRDGKDGARARRAEREEPAGHSDGLLGHARRADHGRRLTPRRRRWRARWTRRRRWRRRRPGGGAAAGGARRSAASSDAGYLPMNPCATPTVRGRGGAAVAAAVAVGGGGGLGGPAPYVHARRRTRSRSTCGGKVLDSKPLKIVIDPDVHFAAGEHEQYNAIVTDLHAIQRRGVAMATRAQHALSADGRRARRRSARRATSRRT